MTKKELLENEIFKSTLDDAIVQIEYFDGFDDQIFPLDPFYNRSSNTLYLI